LGKSPKSSSASVLGYIKLVTALGVETKQVHRASPLLTMGRWDIIRSCNKGRLIIHWLLNGAWCMTLMPSPIHYDVSKLMCGHLLHVVNGLLHQEKQIESDSTIFVCTSSCGTAQIIPNI